jgi:glycosyltransferase involved in cell wall biosynthesis
VRPSLLAVCTVVPWPIHDGYTLRVGNILRALAPDWAITLVAPRLAEVPGIAEYVPVKLDGRGLTYPWRFDQHPLAEAVDRAVRNNRPDRALVWPGAESLWFSRPDLPPAVADVIDCSALEFWRDFRCFRDPRARLRNMRELGVAAYFSRRTVRSFAATICAGRGDAAWLRRIGGRDSVHVVPNGVDLPTLTNEAATPTLGFVGTLSYPPNIDAVLHAARNIWPIVSAAVPAARFVIAGRSPVPEVRALGHQPGIEIQADVADMAEVLGKCWVSIAPMRTGVGIKNKVLESWACARPAVMTTLATNGLVLPPGHAALVGTTSADLASAVIRLLDDAALRHKLGQAAHAHVRCHFTWAGAARRFDGLLRDATRDRLAATRTDFAAMHDVHLY